MRQAGKRSKRDGVCTRQLIPPEVDMRSGAEFNESMPERPESIQFDPHEAAGISEVLISPEGLYNPAADMLKAEAARLESKIGSQEKHMKENMAIAVAAILTFAGREVLPDLVSHVGYIASSPLDWSLDVFRELGVNPLTSAIGGTVLAALNLGEADKLSSKLAETTEKLRRAKAKTSFSHGAE